MTAPILTVIHLNPDHPEVRRDHDDVCAMHARVISLLSLGPDQPKGRELWAHPSSDRLIVQYHRSADPRWLPDGYTAGVSHHAVRHLWDEGAAVRWALIGNPVSRTGKSERHGIKAATRVLVSPADLAGWARSRLPMLEHASVTVADARTAVGRRGAKAVTHRQVRLVGTARVLDAAALATAIHNGVGRARAFGCGLLLVTEAT